VVLHEQYTGGEDGEPTSLFWTMLYILLLPVVFNVIIAVIFNKRKGAKAVSLAVLVEILHLGPVVKGWKVWKGEERGQDDVVDPYEQFLMGRISELLCEGLPELVLATTMLYTGKATTKVVVSLCMSLASAAFMMMDASVGFERNHMVSAESARAQRRPRQGCRGKRSIERKAAGQISIAPNSVTHSCFPE
jgi:hypothetical protein